MDNVFVKNKLLIKIGTVSQTQYVNMLFLTFSIHIEYLRNNYTFRPFVRQSSVCSCIRYKATIQYNIKSLVSTRVGPVAQSV